jgi:5-methylcytosine-specific restriction endonuclease McrA
VLGDNGKVNRRLHWHRQCASAWRFMNDRFYARQVIRARDGGQCAACPTQCAEDGWEVDHIRPLVLANGDYSFFLQSNVQTLCKPCHRAKSATEQSLDKTSVAE